MNCHVLCYAKGYIHETGGLFLGRCMEMRMTKVVGRIERSITMINFA